MTYRPWGGSESFLQLSDQAATEATLTGLQCNTNYTITVVATAGGQRREGSVFLRLQGKPQSHVHSNIVKWNMMSISILAFLYSQFP